VNKHRLAASSITYHKFVAISRLQFEPLSMRGRGPIGYFAWSQQK